MQKEKIVNNIILVGRAGRDPELRYFESGSCVADFSLAVNRPTKNKETDWFNIKVWGRQAEIAGEFVKKGSLIAIEGEIDFESWIDKTSGQEQNKSVVVANNLRLLGGRSDNQQPGL
jgi:single-strand DNA-binding protein